MSARAAVFGLALAAMLALVAPSQAHPDTPASRWLALPFAQRLDMDPLREVTRSPPEQLLATIERFEVDLRVVRSAAAGKPLNPLLSGLPAAPAELVRQADFRDSYEGRVILRGAACCALARDTTLIRDFLDLFVFRAQDPRVKIPKASGQPKPSAVSSLAVQTVLR